MKRVYVNEQWCLGCHLCEYYCAFANSGKSDMVKALKGAAVHPNIRIEEGPGGISFAVACRHCSEPLCVRGCISGALIIGVASTVFEFGSTASIAKAAVLFLVILFLQKKPQGLFALRSRSLDD